MSLRLSLLKPTMTKPTTATTRTMTIRVTSMVSPQVWSRLRSTTGGRLCCTGSPGATPAASAAASTGEATAASARGRALGGLVRRDRRAHGRGEVVGHRGGERAGGVPAAPGADVRRVGWQLAGLDPVLLGPLLGHAEGHRPGDVG